ncbi:DNA polymerase III subunit alpha [Bacteroidia bacterium]|nr:DNA polymerase III subunit alpha [Bacteroidia bacterium]MDB4106939.1 DNA polymerase III subunit alpha [Bacteroidia bacterium]MDB9882664.1 DNA polymerase III subunit alpha [Bacteroidia bacterium]
MSPKELLCEADTVAHGYNSRLVRKGNHGIIALTDINSTSGCLYHALECQNRGWPVVMGVDFRTGNKQQFVTIAKNNEGFQNINLFLSAVLAKTDSLEVTAPILARTIVIYPIKNVPGRPLRSNEYIGVNHAELFDFQKVKTNASADRYVALNTVTFRNKRDFNAHRLLRAIDKNALLSKLPVEEQGELHHRFYSLEELEQLYSGYEYLLENTEKLLASCSLHFDFNDKTKLANKKTFTQTKKQDNILLDQLVNEGLKYRYANGVSQEVKDRVAKELGVIIQCDFVPYFLINHNIVNYARKQGYFYVGRGSGANSLVAYLLRITNVDPIELDLYFERFINPSRKSPPDFDIDFSWRDRQDVTRYIFDTFPNTALMGSFTTFQARSVIREIGKVLGLTADEIKNIQRTNRPQDLDHLGRLCILYSRYIHGFPNHLSVHSCGIVITDRPIQYYGATSMPPKGFPTAHFDMHIAEDAGIYKYDILGQRGLGKIKDAITIIKQNQPHAAAFDIDDIDRFKKDEKIKDLLRRGDAIGCFYVESPAMRALMKKLEVDDYRGLVVASSIIRPGVSNSGMMGEYIKRHRSPEARKKTHPVLAKILHDTYGVMVYQEDVLKVAHYFAGLTLEESDVLRRGMSFKYRERTEFKTAEKLFFDNCEKKGYDPKLTKEVWTQIESFASYAFAKGHSASYAVESYQSLFLKAYFPLEYMVATVNNFGGFYRTEQYIQEARLKGAHIAEPCVNSSNFDTTISGKDIFLGFQHVAELEGKVIDALLANRRDFGQFDSLENFTQRVGISLDQTVILIRINAFRFTGKTKHWLLWKAHFLLAAVKKSVSHPSLFAQHQNAKKVTIPELDTVPYEDAMDEIEYLGFPMCSPFDLIDEDDKKSKIVSADFKANIGKTITLLGYLVHTKRTKTKGCVEQEMFFGTFMDLDGQFFDSVHFPLIARRYRFKGRGIYLIRGMVSSDFGHITLEAQYMYKVPYGKLIKEP